MAQTIQQQEPNQSDSLKTDPKSPQPKNVRQVVGSRICRLSASSSTQEPTNSTAVFDNSLPLTPRVSKSFITKYRAELEALLLSIKDRYHQDFKSLADDDSIQPDLFVHIGQEFKKSLHKCLVASRAHKLYTALKAFEVTECQPEEDIIIREIQEKAPVVKEEKTRVDDADSEISVADKADNLTVNCFLPEDLITPELLINFTRRVYLNTELDEDESKLTSRLVHWIKANKPELIRQPNKHSPDHRESFRTIQPDFEDLFISKSPVNSFSNTKRALHNNNDLISENQPEDMDEQHSQATSVKDESLTSSLTRTETFELITRSTQDNSPIGTPSKNILTESGIGNDQNEDMSDTNSPATTPQPYAPTTRTGLHPKTFTTPSNLRTPSRTSTPSSTNSSAAISNAKQSGSKLLVREDSIKTTTATRTSKLASPTPAIATPPTAAKRSSLSNKPHITNESLPDIQQTKQVAGDTAAGGKIGAKSIPSVTGKVAKLKSITRAHPISMERSQSPGTNVVIKSSGKNFIAANKRLVSQIEKKVAAAAAAQNPEQNHPQPEEEASEVNDTSFYVLEPTTIDSLIPQLDKFTLISHSKLAESLLRLFMSRNLTDTIILLKNDKQVEAHKCILAARSAYFHEIIANQPESATASKQKLTIDLSEYSYSAVYFSLLHIYSGVAKVPDDIDLEELTKLTHLLHVTTLSQICMQNLKSDLCHFFHKPCSVCSIGVLRVLPLAWRYDYEELYTKCLQWIGAHFSTIFCLREFSELQPHDLLEECYSAALKQLTSENIETKTLECQKLLKSLDAQLKWTESIICLVERLEDACLKTKTTN